MNLKKKTKRDIISGKFLSESIEKRIVFYINSLPHLEKMCSKLLDSFIDSKLDHNIISAKDLICLYVRLYEVHERVLSLTSKLFFEESSKSFFLSEDEKEFLDIYCSMSESQKKQFKETYGKRK